MFRTPHVSTIIGALSRVWYVPVTSFISENFLLDTLSALSLMIAFYYALTGIACAIYYRHELLEERQEPRSSSASAPSSGPVILGYLFVKSAIDLSDAENSYTGAPWLGVGPPLVIGLGFLLLGVVLMVLWRLGGHDSYFGRKPGVVDPELAARAAAGPT